MPRQYFIECCLSKIKRQILSIMHVQTKPWLHGKRAFLWSRAPVLVYNLKPLRLSIECYHLSITPIIVFIRSSLFTVKLPLKEEVHRVIWPPCKILKPTLCITMTTICNLAGLTCSHMVSWDNSVFICVLLYQAYKVYLIEIPSMLSKNPGILTVEWWLMLL